MLSWINRICIPFFIGTELVSTCSSHVLSASQCNGSKSLVCYFQDQPMLLYNSHTSALPSSGSDRENHGEDRGHSWNTAEPLSAWCPDRVHTGEPRRIQAVLQPRFLRVSSGSSLVAKSCVLGSCRKPSIESTWLRYKYLFILSNKKTSWK